MSEETHTASHEDAVKARLPIGWRDYCGDLLIKLNRCRHDALYAPWKCTDERHTYEKCQYDDMIKRKMAKETQERKRLEEDE